MNVWSPLCALKFPASLASELCSYMGYSASLSYSLLPPNQTAISDYHAPLQEVRSLQILYHTVWICKYIGVVNPDPVGSGTFS